MWGLDGSKIVSVDDESGPGMKTPDFSLVVVRRGGGADCGPSPHLGLIWVSPTCPVSSACPVLQERSGPERPELHLHGSTLTWLFLWFLSGGGG